MCLMLNEIRFVFIHLHTSSFLQIYWSIKLTRSIAFNYYCLQATIHEMAYLEFFVPSAE